MAVDLDNLGGNDNDYSEDSSTFYVWTPIRTSDGSTIPVGTEVGASHLGIDDEEFEEYIDSGAVRNVPYPVSKDEANSLAPATHYKREAARMSGNLDQDV